MDRLTVLNFLLLGIIVWAWGILTQVGIDNWVDQRQLIWVSFILIHFIAGLFLGFAGFKMQNERSNLSIVLMFASGIVLLNILLTTKIDTVLDLLSGSGMSLRGVIGAAASMIVGFTIPLVVFLSRSSTPQAVISEMPSSTKITDVILETTGVRCPICDAYPEQEGHYLIRCYNCSAEFCSKHLDQYEDRCWRCRTPLPFLNELKNAIKENLSSLKE